MVTRIAAVVLAAAMAIVELGAPPSLLAAEAPPPALPDLVVPSEDRLVADEAIEVVDTAEPITDTIDLTPLVADAAARASAIPTADWDLDALAEALSYDPQAAFAFVRDEVGFDAYAGVLRGAQGTLGGRAGNSFDRAILLHDLLEAMLIPVRYAVGTLDGQAAEAVLERALEPAPPAWTAEQEAAGRAPLDFEAIGRRAHRDYARLRAALGDRVSAFGDPGSARAAADLTRHAWVQAFIGTDWVDLDPTLLDAMPGTTLTTATEVLDAIPDADRQQLAVRVEADIESGGTLTTMSALDATLDAAPAALSEIWLYFQPELAGVGGSIAEALGSAHGSVPILVVDGELIRGSAIPVYGATDIFTGEEEQGTELARVRIVVERTVPGHEPSRNVRTLLDRVVTPVPSDGSVLLAPLEENEAGPVALQPVHQVLVSTGGTSPGRALVRRAMAVELASRFLGLDRFDASFDDLLFPIAVTNETLVLASERALVPSLAAGGDVRAWVSEPRVYLVSISANLTDPDQPAFTTDLLADPVAVVPAPTASPGAAGRAQMWYGVLQSAMETEYLLALARADGGAVRSVSVAGREPLAAFTDPLDPALSGAPASLWQTLELGQVAVVPGEPTSAFGWWAIDPTDGSTRSVSRTGLGFGDYAIGRGHGYPPSKPNTGPRYDITRTSRAARPTTPAGTCNAANEYTTPIGCVSLPGAIAFWGTGLVIAGVVAYCSTLLWQFWLGFD